MFWCGRCELYLEPEDVRNVALAATGRGRPIPTCAHCGLAVRREEAQRSHGLGALARDAFFFLGHRDALFGLLAVAITGGLMNMVPLFASPILGGLGVAYLSHVLRQTAEGRDLTNPPDFVEVADLVGPWLRAVLVFAWAFGPSALALACDLELALPLTLAWAIYYLPAGLILAAHGAPFLRILSPLSAIAVGRAIGRAYVVMAVASVPVLLVAGAIGIGCERIAALGIGLPVVGTALGVGVVLALPTVYARFLGLFVREHRYVLGV